MGVLIGRQRLGHAAAAAATALTIAMLGAGCGGSGSEGPEASSGPPTSLPEIANPTGPRQYRKLVDGTFVLLSEFWAKKFKAEGEEPPFPKRLVSYEGKSDEVRCDGEPAVPMNAFYCPKNTTIAWDSDLLLGDFYRYVGDAGVAFLLAHEYGHFIQDKIDIQNRFRLTIESELNADCLAGAFLHRLESEFGRLTSADINSLAFGVTELADPRGVPWWNPQAHGTVAERADALDVGLERGLKACERFFPPGFG